MSTLAFTVCFAVWMMVSTVVPIWLISHATEYRQFLVLGLFVGLAGGSLSAGTPYVARWFDKKDQSFAMGVFGISNSGAAVNRFVAPATVVAFGWKYRTEVRRAEVMGPRCAEFSLKG